MKKLCRALFKYENKIKLVWKINIQLFISLKWVPVYKKVTSWDGPRPLCISYEPKINSKTVQGEKEKDGARIAMGGQGVQGGQDATGKAKVPEKSRADVSIYVFWKWRISTIFDMQIVK